MDPELNSFKGHFIKCVYQDGDHATVARGDLIEVTDNFIKIKTLENIILIKVSGILKIQRSIEGRF